MPSDVTVPAGQRPIPLCVPEMRGNEWRYLKECLDTNLVSSVGSFVRRFEEMVAGYAGTRHAVATSSGTAALHVALLVAGVEPDDEVIMSTLSFVAPANAVRYLGAWPVFMDAEPKHWEMDTAKTVEFLETQCSWSNGQLRNRTTKRRIRAILPVHILGHPVEMDPILEIAERFALPVIEDATESLGARYKDRMVGNLGNIACFSFNGNKIITTGGGGMIVTDNEAWAARARYLTTQAKDDPVEYVHHQVGYNYRLTNLQAAIGCAQMEQLETHIAHKRQLADVYREKLAEVLGITPMRPAIWAFSVEWMFTILVDPTRFGTSSRNLLRILERHSIQSRPLWQPLHRSPAHRGSQGWCISEADRLFEQGLSLPCSTGLTRDDQARVCEALRIACTPCSGGFGVSSSV